MESLTPLIVTLLVAIGLCLIGETIRVSVPGLRRIMLPGSVIGGIIALALGPQGASLQKSLPSGEQIQGVLGNFPPLFINVVFAALMLGRPIGNLADIWRQSRPQIIMGHIYAWGQYVVGILLVLLLLAPVFDIHPLAGTVIAIGFQGGHGTAAGLDATFSKLGFADGKTVAYALATFGILAGTVLGPLLANHHRQHPDKADDDLPPSGDQMAGSCEKDDASDEDSPTVEFSPLTGSLTIHLAMVALVILVASVFLKTVIWLEASLLTHEEGTPVSEYVPLFSVVLVVGFITQLLLQKLKLDHLVKRPTVDLISAFALDMVIFGALASLDLTALGNAWGTVLILCIGGLLWNLTVYFVLGPRIYPRPWYAYGLGDLGGGTATTASGLLLIRVVDPKQKTNGKLAYTAKQPLYEPFMGGGLITALALPVVAGIGLGYALLITSLILAAWVVLAIRLIRK